MAGRKKGGLTGENVAITGRMKYVERGERERERCERGREGVER
jgi:hypothetical protein